MMQVGLPCSFESWSHENNEFLLDSYSTDKNMGVDSGVGSPGTCFPIIKLGAKPFLPPNNPEENFLKILKRETRDTEIK